MSWKKVKIKDVLKQYRVQHIVKDDIDYNQVSILNNGSVVLRGNKIGKEIGRKRQFKIDLKTYPNTLIFTRQLLLQGSIGIASEDVNDCIVTENMPMFSIQTSKIDKEFLILFLKSEVFKSRIRKIELSGSAQKSIHEKTFLDLEFLIPDINLQKIIVVELLKLKSNGDTISTELTQQLNLIKQLRQAFLREAMKGKLLKISNIKETGQQLLTKIKAEKAQLIADKKLKKEKELSPISEDEIPFEIPEHWAWCRLGVIINISSGDGLTASQMDKNGTIPVYGGNGINGYHNKYTIDKETIVIGRVGYYCGCVHLTSKYAWVTDNAFIVKYSEKNINRDFLIQLLKWADLGKQQFAGSQPVISGQRVYPKLTPFPPLHEQEQIIAKLEELMAYCDGLEQSIKESQGYNEMLLQQVLREALRKDPVGLV